MNVNRKEIKVRLANTTRFGARISATAMGRITILLNRMEIAYNFENHTPSHSLARSLIDLARESRMGLTDALEYLQNFKEGDDVKPVILMRGLGEHGNYNRHEYMEAYNNRYLDEYMNNSNNNNNNNDTKKNKKVLMQAVEEEIVEYEKKDEEKKILKKRKRVELHETQSLLKDVLNALTQRDLEVEGLKRQIDCLVKNAKRLTGKIEKITETLECPVCMLVMDEPRFIGCGHIVCTRCMDSQFDTGKNFCPICKWKPVIMVAGLMPRVYALETITEIIEPQPPLEVEGTQFPNTQSDEEAEEEDSIVITENVGGEPLDLNESDVDSEEEY